MKHLHSLAAAVAVAFTPALPVDAQASAAPTSRPGYIEFGALAAPRTGGQVVEINVQGMLLSLASRFIEKSEPAVAEIVRNLHSVRVNVVSLDDSNREAVMQQAAALHETLDAGGWSRVATVRDAGDNVAIYLRTNGQESIEGVTITVLEDSGEAVFINVVGDIKPEQLATLGEQLGIDPLKRAGEAASS